MMTQAATDETIDFADSAAIPHNVTGDRILVSILFVLILALAGTVLAFVVLFELAYALCKKESPGARVTRFANRITRYAFEICQFLTYNTNRPPFPFEDLPK